MSSPSGNKKGVSANRAKTTSRITSVTEKTHRVGEAKKPSDGLGLGMSRRVGESTKQAAVGWGAKSVLKRRQKNPGSVFLHHQSTGFP
jgi:hypothetical protein